VITDLLLALLVAPANANPAIALTSPRDYEVIQRSWPARRRQPLGGESQTVAETATAMTLDPAKALFTAFYLL